MTALRSVLFAVLLVLPVLVSPFVVWGDPDRADGSHGARASPAQHASARVSGSSRLSPSSQGHQVYLGYFDESQILVGTAEGLVKTTGAGWQVIFPWPTDWGGSDVTIAPDGTMYVVLTNRYDNSLHLVYSSTNGGQTWDRKGELPWGTYQIFASSAPNLVFTAGIGIYLSEYPVYRSTDGGTSWTPGLGLGDGYTYTYSCSCVACSPAFAQDGTAFAVLRVYKGSVGVWKTTDWGVTWTPVCDGLYQGPAAYGYVWVGVSPQYPQDQTAFTLDWHGVYQTTNGGASWTQVLDSTYPNPAFLEGALSPRYPQDRTLVMSGYYPDGLWLSQDGGCTWRSINSCDTSIFGIRASGPLVLPLPPPAPGALRVYLPLVVQDRPPWRVYLPWVERAGLEFWVICNNYLYRSTDYGATWELVPVEY